MNLTVSYSGLGMYSNCPSSFARKYIKKEEVEPQTSAAMGRGLQFHKIIEDYLNGKTEELPKSLKFYAQFFAGLRENETLECERKWAFNEEWEEVDFESDEARIRGIVDAVLTDGNTCYVYEFKTGKIYEDHDNQRALYGLAGLLLSPMADNVVVTTMYLDLKKNKTSNLDKSMVPSYQWVWARRINKVQPPQPYRERPNWKCKFCPYSKKNGGTCSN